LDNLAQRAQHIPLIVELVGVPYRIRTGVAAVRELQNGRHDMLLDDDIYLTNHENRDILSGRIQCCPGTSL
jgi:hypothetical protein